MRLVFFGPPGSGKGTQALLLRDRQGYSVIGTGEMLREAIRNQSHCGIKVERFVTTGQLVPDDLVNELVAERFANKPPAKFIMDGYPRTVAQALVLDENLKKLNISLEKAFLFTVPDDEIVRRLSNRGRSDDSPETVRRRLEIYHETENPLTDHYRRANLLTEISALGDVESIYGQICQHLKS